MKKNYFIFSLLALAATSALAQVEEATGVGKGNKLTDLSKLDDTEAFTLVVPDATRGALIAVGDNAYATGTQEGVDPNADADNQQFAIVSKDDNYYLFSISEQKFVNKGAGDNAVLSIVGQPVEFIYAEGNYWQIYLSEKRLNFGNGGGMAINDWANIKYAGKGNNEEDGGNKFTITSVGTSDAITAAIAKAKELLNTTQVTFKLQVGGEVVNQQANVTQVIGQAPEVPAGLVKDFAQYTVAPAIIQEGTTEVIVTFTNYEFPFKLSENFASAKWYFVSLKGKQAAWNAATNINHDQGDIGDNKTDAAQYAFIGNADDYDITIKVINKAAGADKTLQVADTNEDSNAVEFLEEDAAGKQKVWSVLDRKDGNFMLQTEKGGKYINSWGGDADWKLWNGANDEGSFFKVQAVPEAALVNVTYKIQYNGEVVASATVQQYEGADYELPTNINLGNLLEYTFPTGTVVADAEIVVEAAINANSSIKFSEAIDEDTEWLYLIIDGRYSIALEDGLTIDDKQNKEVSEYAMWALVGNPYSFKIYNLAFGEYSLHFAAQDNGANGQLLEDNNDATWTIKGNGGTYLIYNENGYYLNDHGSQHILIAWDNGSGINIEDVPAEDIAAIESTPTPVSSIEAAEAEVEGIFTIDGRKVEKLQRGVNIIRQRNAEGGIDVKKVIVK